MALDESINSTHIFQLSISDLIEAFNVRQKARKRSSLDLLATQDSVGHITPRTRHERIS